MDKLVNEFTVNRPIDQAWNVLTDLELIAPCMPGAQLQEVEGDVFRGVVKVKLGAISTAFKGQATFLERDDDAHRAVLKGEGRDTGGKGNADALITATLDSLTPATTKCVVETDLRITGKVAQFGRGIMADVSKKLMNQFADNLNTMLDEQGRTTDAAPEQQGADAAVDEIAVDGGVMEREHTDTDTGSGDGSPSGQTSAEPARASATSSVAPAGDGAADTSTVKKPTVRTIEGPAAEPIELTGVAGNALLKRLLPVVAGLVVLLLAVRRLRK